MAENEQGSTTDESPADVPGVTPVPDVPGVTPVPGLPGPTGATGVTGVTGAYGEAKARELLRQFREDTGRDPASATELAEWIIQRFR